MSKIHPLFSGSKGNSTYITGKGTSLLVDAGVSFKALSSALEAAGQSVGELSAVLVTHTHTDHIRGLKALLTAAPNAVLAASTETLEALAADNKIPAHTKTVAVSPCAPLEINGVGVSFFPTSHDCAGSGGYSFFMPDDVKITVCTDLGHIDNTVRSALCGSAAVLLEANYDPDMLKNGPYPAMLKMRIMSGDGHLSNYACAAELPPLLKSGTGRFILGHLSQNNNTPLLALSAARAALTDAGAKEGADFTLTVAAPKDNGVIVL